MGLQKCTKCSNRFTWSTIYKSLLLGYKPIKCSDCNTELRITFFSRIIASILTVLPIYLIGVYLANTIYFSIPAIFFVIILSGILISFIFPFLMKYRAS